MTKSVKLLIITNLLTLLVLGGIMLKEHYPQKILAKLKGGETPAKDGKIFYWLQRDQIFEALPNDTNAIDFLGTSLTENFELSELLGNCNVRNRGITGDHTKGILNRLKPVIADKPQKIFIEVGVNDLGKGVDEKTLLENYSAILDRLQQDCPTSRIYIESILPVANKGEYPTYNNPEVNEAIRRVNTQLKAMAESRKMTYIDVYSKFEKNGEIDPAYVISDGIHLKGAAYLVWADVLRPFVNE